MTRLLLRLLLVLACFGICSTETYAQSPTVANISPTYGLHGSSITITGTNFTGTKSVLFSGIPAKFTIQSATQLSVTVPATAPTGAIRITTANGTILTPTYTVTRQSNSHSFSSATGFSYTAYTYNGNKTAGNTSPIFTDIDNDGLIDLLVGTIDGTLERYEQSTVNSLSFNQVVKALISNNARGYFAPAVTDLDGDGLLDILVGDDQGYVGLYEQTAVNGTGFTYANTNLFNVDLGSNAAPAVSDLDGDGLLDVLVGLQDGRFEHFEQDAANGLTFTRRTNSNSSFSNLQLSGSHGYAQPKIVDIDGNGLLDLVVGHYDGHTLLFEQNEPNSLTFAGNTSLIGDVGDHASPALTDLNGDGLLDVVMGEWKARLTYYSQSTAPKAELGVTISASGTPFATGKTATFIVTLTNNGPSSASGITVTDLLDPAKFQNITSSDAAYVPANQVWSAGSLLSNASKTLTITAQPLTAGSISVHATQKHAEVDLVPTNNSSTATINVVTAADIEVKNTVPQTTYNNGDVITYTITARNLGPDRATNVIITDKLPTGLVLQGTAPTGYNQDTGDWSVGSLDLNETKSLTLITKPSSQGTFTTSATLKDRSYDQLDENTSNNNSNNTVTVNPAAEVSLTNTVSNSSPNQNSSITYTLVVTNNGPNPASNVVITGTQPTGLTFTGTSASVGTASLENNAITWNVGTMAVGAKQTLVLNASTTNVGKISFTASQTHTENDTNLSNNSAEAIIDVQPTTDVAVTNTISGGPTYAPNETVTYTVTANNFGPSSATNVVITDLLPATLRDLTYSSTTGTITQTVLNDGTTQLTWTIGTISANPGTLPTMTVIGTINNSAILTSTATQTHTEYDLVNGNNSATNSITAGNGIITADIIIGITASGSSHYTGKDISFTLRAANQGPDAGNNIKIEVDLPAGLSLQSTTSLIGTFSTSDNTWTIPSLAANTAGTSYTELTLVARPLADLNTGPMDTKTYTVSAELASLNEVDDNANNNNCQASVTVEKQAEVALAITVTSNSPDGKFYHNVSEATFTITATNNGPDLVTGLVGQDTQTGTIRFTAQPVASIGSYNTSTGYWDIGSLTTGQSATLVVKGIPNTTGSLHLGGSITSADQADLNQENNQAITLLNVLPVADLVVTNNASPTTLYNGQQTSFTVTVQNNGPDVATDVVIQDMLPDGLDLLSYTASSGAYDLKTGRWTLGSDILPGSTNAQTLVLTVKPKSAVQYTTTASILASSQHDHVSTNNSQSSAIQVIASADIAVTGSMVPGPYYVGGQYEVKITVTNLGPDAATGVVMAAGVAPGLNMVPGSGRPAEGTSIDPATGIWTIGNLGLNESKTLTLLAQPTTIGTLTSLAYKSESKEYDPNGENTTSGNNSAVITMNVYDKSATHQDFLDNYHFFYYRNNDVLAQFTDADGPIVNAVLTSGSTLPAGITLTTDGILKVTNKSLLTAGTFTAEVTTTDQNGGTTTQTIDFTITDDWDGDGLTDAHDVDDNFDGISDILSGAGVDPFGDLDGDGILNYADQTNGTDAYHHPVYGSWLDQNGDSINDWFDLDLDGIPNNLDVDIDGDGITNITEANSGINPDQSIYSHTTGTMLGSVDTNTGMPVNSLSNGASIFAMPDTDADGFKDFLDVDADNDGLLDMIEAQAISVGKTGYRTKLETDTNRNGLDSAFDTNSGGGEPLTPVNSDAQATINPDTTPDYLDTDSDSDVAPDFYEGHDYDLNGKSLDDYKLLATKYNTAFGTVFYDNSIDTDKDDVPNWLEENEIGKPNFLNSTTSYYKDTDQDGLVDLFDADTFGNQAIPAQKSGATTAEYRDASSVVPLPVTLISFTAEAEASGVLLNWETASEKDNEYFQVERSTDGKNFIAIGKVAGNGTSAVRQEYSFLDTQPAHETAYYRLKQVDFNGAFEYSKTIAIKSTATKALLHVNVYPNPTTEAVQLDFSGIESGQVTVSVYSATGRLAISHQMEIGSTQKIDFTTLPAGVYLMKIKGATFEIVKRIVKQ